MSLINVAHLTFAYEGGLENIFEDVCFRIDTDWKLGFTGRNGRGKTTFLNLLLGRYEYEGTISSSVDFEYFPYDVPDEEMVTLELIRSVAPGAEEWEIAREVSLLDVADDALRRPFRTLSNGERTKEMREQHERAENERLKKEIGRMQEAARRTSDWSDKVEKTKRGVRNSGLRPDTGYIGHKAAKMAQRSKSIDARRQSAIEEKSALLRNVEKSDELKLIPLVYHSPLLAELENVSIRYGERVACEGVSFTVGRGERIALQGKNGSGKSSVLKLLHGESLEYGGRLTVGSGVKISYVAQSADDLRGSPREYARASGIDESLFRMVLDKLDFSKLQFEKDMADYSGGQKKKVLLARSLCEQAHLYIWDEPLNYVDVISRIQITDLLLEFRPTMLFVEHDRAFCDEVGTKIARL